MAEVVTTIGEFLINGAADMWERVRSDQPWNESDQAYWTEERRLIRDTERLLRKVDDELTFRLEGRRIRPVWTYDQARIQGEQERAGEYETLDLNAGHVVTYSGPLGPEYIDTSLETSLAESEAEAEQRRFNERNQ